MREQRADAQLVGPVAQVQGQLAGVVAAGARHVPHVDDGATADLAELVRVELRQQVFQTEADQRVAFAAGHVHVFVERLEIGHVLHGNHADDVADRGADHGEALGGRGGRGQQGAHLLDELREAVVRWRVRGGREPRLEALDGARQARVVHGLHH
ncbi:conserved hypothetical protein, partial [Ricinus communis]